MPSVGDPEALAAVTPKVGNNGADPFKILQPDQQAAFVAARPTDLANDANGTAIAAAVNGNATAINSIKAALVSAGIMKAS